MKHARARSETPALVGFPVPVPQMTGDVQLREVAGIAGKAATPK